MFQIKQASTSDYWTIKSVKTGMYLASDNEGNTFMKEEVMTHSGRVEDRQTWFRFMPHKERFVETDTLFSFTYTDGISFTATCTYQTSEVEAC